MLHVDTDAVTQAARALEGAALAAAGAVAPMHPPVAADVASATAALRFTERGAALHADLLAGIRGVLSATRTLRIIAGNYDDTEEAIRAAHERLEVTMPPQGTIPRVEPVAKRKTAAVVPMPPPMPWSGDVIAATFKAGSGSRGAGFVAGMRANADHAETAAGAARSAATALDAAWRSPVSAGPAIDYLVQQAKFLDGVADGHRRTATAAELAGENFEDKKSESPTPEDFARLRAQIAQTEKANSTPPTVNRYNDVLATLYQQLNDMEQKAKQAGKDYHSGADKQSEGDADSDSTATDMGQAAGLVSALPGMLASIGATVLGAVSSLASQVPEAAGQAAQQAMSGLSQAMGGQAKNRGLSVPSLNGLGGGGGAGGAGRTSPAGGLEAPLAPATPPAGMLEPATPAALSGTSTPGPAGSSGVVGGAGMPMMPMGARGAGGEGGGDDRKSQQRQLLLRSPKNSEPVKGVLEPPARKPKDPDPEQPTGDDKPSSGGRRIVIKRNNAAPPPTP